MLQIESIFQSGMVVQRDKPFVIWGYADPGTEVHITLQEKNGTAIADACGCWKAVLPPVYASEDEQLLVISKNEKLVIPDVAVGEVWIASGQSNMEFFMRYEKHLSDVKSNCKNKRIRFFDVPEIAYPGQKENFDYSRMGLWRTATPEDIEYFSAVGYYFEKEIEDVLDVPVGIIGCNWGGTVSAAWMNPDSVEKVGKPWWDEYKEIFKDVDMEEYWKKQNQNPMNDRGNPINDPFSNFVMSKTRTQEEMAEFFSSLENFPLTIDKILAQNIPGALYEHMIKTIAPYSIRGVLWYQGESDDVPGRAELYGDMLSALINDWRSLWENEKLPFFIVQLPGFERWLNTKSQFYDVIRNCQKNVSKIVPEVYLASISDVGEQFEIHPKDKKTVGHRLALLARGHIYGEKILCNAPEADNIKMSGNKIIIHFANAEGGLRLNGEPIPALKVTVNGDTIDYSFGIEGENVVLTFEREVPKNLGIKFAQDQFYIVNLYNREDIPAIPFSFDL